MVRLFIGTMLDIAQAENLALLPDELEVLSEAWHGKVKGVPPDNLHLTWKFIGETSGERIDHYKRALEQIPKKFNEIDKPKICFDKLEIWPGANRPKVLVMLAQNPSEPIMRLKELIEECDDFTESEPFKPHITLARSRIYGKLKKHLKSTKPLFLQRINEILPLELNINSIQLINSEIESSGRRYDSLVEIRL